MPTRNLIQNDNLVSISKWLNDNLSVDRKIQACCNALDVIPEKKGIYLWFMRPDAYENELFKSIGIETINPFKIEINDIDYQLVYLGTAGTGKKGNSHLHDRLEWHLCQAHAISNICHGTLSTLRAGIGALLSDNLADEHIQDRLNEFLCKNMFVYWIEGKLPQKQYGLKVDKG